MPMNIRNNQEQDRSEQLEQRLSQSPSALILQELLQQSARLGNTTVENPNEDTFEVLAQMQ